LVRAAEHVDESDLRRSFLEFVAYLEKMAIIHD
jgi:hypothetical protein